MASVSLDTNSSAWASLKRKQANAFASESWLWPAIIATLLTFVMRSPYLGYPDIYVDEEFYLLVGDRMLHGVVPYVDIWDRKPVGLFILFAGIRLLGGVGIWQYQIVACCFVAATALIMWKICRRRTGAAAAFAAASTYIIWLNMYSGAGGQSPVFYNLFTIIAAWMILKAKDSASPATVYYTGMSAMFLFGLILQFKYTAVIEGIFFGFFILAQLFKLGASPFNLLWRGLVLAAVALVPTCCAAAYYALNGNLAPFVYANFFSVFDRAPQPAWYAAGCLLFVERTMLPLALCAGVEIWKNRNISRNSDQLFLIGWAIASILGFAMIGNYFDHYAIPMLLPLCILASGIFRSPFVGPAIFSALTSIVIFMTGWPLSNKAENRDMIDGMTQAITPYTRHGCLFIYDAPMILYRTTSACVPWKYAFPYHLSDGTETHSVGANTQAELLKIINTRPSVIVTASWAFTPSVDLHNQSILYRILRRDYVVTSQHGPSQRFYSVHVLRKLAGNVKGIPWDGLSDAHVSPSSDKN